MARPRKPRTRGEKVIAFIEKYCKVPEGKLVGQPIKLADFQKRFILDVFDNPEGTNTAYLSIARKSGKTGLIACIVLAYLCGPLAKQNATIIVGAQSREQAGIIFKYCTKIIHQSRVLSREIRIIPSQKKLIGIAMNVEFQAIAKQASNAMGLSPLVVIIDEIGQVKGPQDDFYDALTTSQGAYGDEALFIAISTQAAEDGDLFSILLDNQDINKDPHTVSHVYSADKDCELMDKAQWRKANPAMGLFSSISSIEKLARSAVEMPNGANAFRNLNLNQRVDRTSSFVSRDVWKENGNKPIALDPNLPIYAGLDLSKVDDLTAFMLAQFKNGKWNVHTHAWIAEDGIVEKSKESQIPFATWVDQGYLSAVPGASIDYDFVVQEIAEKYGNLTFEMVGFDPHRIYDFQQAMDRQGFQMPLVRVYQGYKGMTPCIERLERALIDRKVRHGNNPVLTSAAFGVTAMSKGKERLFRKKSSTVKIDPLQALAMAFHREGEDSNKKKKAKVNLDSWINDPITM
ncbi:terminase large subunit [Salinisphaera sp. LB1]|uniref:terminase large subunit n=1 Tax=Salinisphaera sp. LB1 TaxID=2183911 RepID=UPI000D70780F|nr:terminase TerL endonuclease subunit [Salinisphaera sp. LB1]AWN17684.1 Phage terminase, large subunit [Salinisphaera sp. LB1]